MINYHTADGPQEYRTATIDNGGKSSSWGEDATEDNSIEIDVHDCFAPVKITANDEETYGDSRDLGCVHTDYSALCINGGADQWFKIWNGNSSNGLVRIISRFESSAALQDGEAEELSGELQNVQEQIGEAMQGSQEPVPDTQDVETLARLLLDPHNGVFLIANDGMPGEGPENTLSNND